MKKTIKKLQLSKETLKTLAVKAGLQTGMYNPTRSNCLGKQSCPG